MKSLIDRYIPLYRNALWKGQTKHSAALLNVTMAAAAAVVLCIKAHFDRGWQPYCGRLSVLANARDGNMAEAQIWFRILKTY